MSERRAVIAGNWKMYKTAQEAKETVGDLKQKLSSSEELIYLAVPFMAIQSAKDAAEGSNIRIGAQNMNDASEGAFTGEISASMLKEAGAVFVLLGHSERRALFSEDSAFINKKIKRAFKEGLEPILCVGEQLSERESDQTEVVLKQQLQDSLEGISSEQAPQLIVAYEPVWAIGTGQTATPEMAQQTHEMCRTILTNLFTQEIADKISILYGGSVNPENTAGLLSQKDIDGVLVGGASLSADSFFQIISAHCVLNK